MVRSAWMAIALGMVVGQVPARAEDTYPIKIKEPAKGDTVRFQYWNTVRTQAKGELPDGRTLTGQEEKKEETTAYLQTILDIPKGQKNASCLRRHYEKAEQKIDDKTTTLPYQKKTVLIEKIKDKKYRFKMEDGSELTGKDADALDTEFNWASAGHWECQTAFLPKKAVRVGESWKFDPKPLLKGLKHDGFPKYDEAKAEATAKLVRTYPKDGRQFGIVETWLEAPLKEIKSGDHKLPVIDGKMILSITSDLCIDGSTNSGTSVNWVQLDCRAQLDLGSGPKPVLNLKGTIKSQTTWQEIKDGR